MRWDALLYSGELAHSKLRFVRNNLSIRSDIFPSYATEECSHPRRIFSYIFVCKQKEESRRRIEGFTPTWLSHIRQLSLSTPFFRADGCVYLFARRTVEARSKLVIDTFAETSTVSMSQKKPGCKLDGNLFCAMCSSRFLSHISSVDRRSVSRLKVVVSELRMK